MHSQLYESSLSLAVRVAKVAEADSRVIGDILTQQLCAGAELAAACCSLCNVTNPANCYPPVHTFAIFSKIHIIISNIYQSQPNLHKSKSSSKSKSSLLSVLTVR